MSVQQEVFPNSIQPKTPNGGHNNDIFNIKSKRCEHSKKYTSPPVKKTARVDIGCKQSLKFTFFFM